MNISAPDTWALVSLSSIFSKRDEKVGDRNITPYSCTNTGIVPREEKFDKSLAASLEKNKVAYKGDFVFGMSRDILNFGMMSGDLGCFSPAYKIYIIEDFRLSMFLERFIRLNHDYYYQAVTGGAREGKGLSEKNLFDLLVPVPPEDELDLIFNMMTLFDQKIALLEESIELTNNMSKSLISGIMQGKYDAKDLTHREID